MSTLSPPEVSLHSGGDQILSKNSKSSLIRTSHFSSLLQKSIAASMPSPSMPGKCIHHDAVCLVLLFSLFLWLIGMCFHHCCCRVLFFTGYASKYKLCSFLSLFKFFILVILLSIFNLNYNITFICFLSVVFYRTDLVRIYPV